MQNLHVESVTILLPQLREQDSHVAQKRFTFGWSAFAILLHIWVKQYFHFEQVIMILLLRSAEQDFINPVFKI